MTKNEKIEVLKWYCTTRLIGIDHDTCKKIKNGEINNLKALEDIVKNKGRGGSHLCLRCIHVSHEICHRCENKDEGFRFRYKYYQNRMREEKELYSDVSG